ncbi:helix-turn-helix domain-containing protein, partial [Pantoea endophytica]
VKLQAFIDAAFGQEPVIRTPVWSDLYLSPFRKELTDEGFKKWLITLNLKREGRNSNICDLLRSTESYWVIRFLLNSYDNELSLKSMGERYGLSSSHFRRITKQALGNSTKYELCQWRLSNALLELLEGDISITDVAIKHGYASLSHFSNEVKSTLGIPPRKLKNLIECISNNETSK